MQNKNLSKEIDDLKSMLYYNVGNTVGNLVSEIEELEGRIDILEEEKEELNKTIEQLESNKDYLEEKINELEMMLEIESTNQDFRDNLEIIFNK
jgi:chaperonin cofactor prefoldin